VRGLAPNGVDAAIDCVGTDEAVDVSLELVADRDRIASIAAFPRGAGVGTACLGIRRIGTPGLRAQRQRLSTGASAVAVAIGSPWSGRPLRPIAAWVRLVLMRRCC
jgi:threonine dehydrogenase-like Zn-dependent dehydrogenase